MRRKPIPETRKFETPKDIRFQLYTNDEIIAILEKYNREILATIIWEIRRDGISTGSINKLVMNLDRMKFLIGQIKQGKP